MCVVAGTVGAAVAGSATSSLLSNGNSGAQSAANAADPFASQRGQYQTMLSNLINNPSSITSNPGYQFGLQQSQNAVEGSAAANGMVNSGNVLQALSTNAQGYASQQLSNQELLARSIVRRKHWLSRRGWLYPARAESIESSCRKHPRLSGRSSHYPRIQRFQLQRRRPIRYRHFWLRSWR